MNELNSNKENTNERKHDKRFEKISNKHKLTLYMNIEGLKAPF